MYQRGMKWETYLEFEGFKDDIVHGLERQTSEAAVVQAQTAYALNAGFGEMIAGQREMDAVMQSGFAAVSYGLESVSNGIESLRADFDWAMGAVLWKVELQHATLRNILTTLQAPLDTQAKELRSRAEDAYVNGWYDEALTDLLESEQKNYQDFAVHQTIGNIYLYHRQPADLDKAREYYQKAGKYATPRSASYAAQSFMHTAFVCYLQRDDQAAIEHARRATELAPQLVEAFFNHAKFAAAAGQAVVAIPSLERTIRIDRNYAIKARADADFENIEAAVADLMERLRSEARAQAETQVQGRTLQTEMDRYVIAPQERALIERTQAEVEDLMKQDTYFGYLDVLVKSLACRKVFESLRLPERDRLRAQVTDASARLKAARAEYVVPDLFRTRLNCELAEIERLLAELTFASASAARDKMDICEQQWKRATERVVLEGHSDDVGAVAFSPDGATLASSGSHDDTVRLWDVATGRERAVLEHSGHVYNIAFSPDGATLASTASDYTLWLWDVAAGCERAVLEGHTGYVSDIAFSPDGATLASGSKDNTVRLWDVATGCERTVLTGHTNTVKAIAFSPDGATLASGDGGTVRLWDVATGRERAVLTRPGGVYALAFSSDGATLASSSDDRTVRLWDVATSRERAVLKGHTDYVHDITFSPDGATLASGSLDRTVRLWDVATSRERAVLKGHNDHVDNIVFSPDGATLASGSGDRTVRLWDVATGRERAVLKGHTDQARAVAFSPDGATLASGSWDHTVRLWGLAIHKAEWERVERERQEEERKRDEEKRKREQEEKRKQEEEDLRKQQQAWRAAGCCETCGEKLGFLDKAGGHARCKKHR
jgi:WD40 repeat protein/tetratricopeptide (TPR) repeat protein